MNHLEGTLQIFQNFTTDRHLSEKHKRGTACCNFQNVTKSVQKRLKNIKMIIQKHSKHHEEPSKVLKDITGQFD